MEKVSEEAGSAWGRTELRINSGPIKDCCGKGMSRTKFGVERESGEDV